MEWALDNVEDGETVDVGVDKAFVLIRDGPPTLTAREIKPKDAREEARPFEQAEKELELAAYSELYDNEPEQFRKKRAAAFDRCFGHLSQRIQSTLEDMDTEVFTAILELATAHHPTASKRASLPRYGQHRLPTALVLAGGVNSADHVTTFPNLANFLKSSGCYVALLQQHDVGKAAGEAINACLRQFADIQSSSEHFDALAAWYRDEAGPLPGAADSEHQNNTEPVVIADSEEEEEDEDEPAAASAKRRFQQREKSHPKRRQNNNEKIARQQVNASKPLVVIIEGTESVDAACLQDFIAAFSEGYADVPVTLILGLTTTASALNAMLPTQLIDRCMQCIHLKLASAVAQLEMLVRDVLLGASGEWPGLLLDGGVVDALWDRFFLHYFSSSIIKQGIQVAALSHFRTQPASFLAFDAAEGHIQAVKSACQSLPEPVATAVKHALGMNRGPRSGAAVAEGIQEAMNSYSRWSLAILWTSSVAQYVGLTNGFTCWQLYRDALHPSFLPGTYDKDLQPRLARQVTKLNKEQALELIGTLLQTADAIWGSANVSDIVDGIKEIQHKMLQDEPDTATQADEDEDVDADDDEDADAQQQKQSGGTTKKRDRFHSKASRSAALLQKAANSKPLVNGKSAGNKKQAKHVDSPGDILARWLFGVLRGALEVVPTKLPAAKVFTCSDVTSLDCLSAAPRDTLHMALSEPEVYLGGEALGTDPPSEDACIAYQLLDQDPACLNIPDWFQAFCEVHLNSNDIDDSEEQAEAVGKNKGKKKTVKEDRTTNASSLVSKKELAARFSQATAELQLVGLIKPSKRRRGDYVQRLIHMPAPDLKDL